MNRPALIGLLEDVDSGLVDMIVVYKIDRLTRSLADFAKLIDRLEGVVRQSLTRLKVPRSHKSIKHRFETTQ